MILTLFFLPPRLALWLLQRFGTSVNDGHAGSSYAKITPWMVIGAGASAATVKTPSGERVIELGSGVPVGEIENVPPGFLPGGTEMVKDCPGNKVGTSTTQGTVD